MKTVRLWEAVSVAIVFAVGCGGPSVETRIESFFREGVMQQLKNPSSAEFLGGSAKKVVLPNISNLGAGRSGYFVCALVRATNSFGGVVPQAFQGFFTDSGAALYVGTVEDTPWGMHEENIHEQGSVDK